MNSTTLLKISSAACIAIGLSACGGGGDSAGSPSGFSVSPDTLTVNAGSSDTSCLTPVNGFVFNVYGGVAPYHIDNPFPQYISLSTDTVAHPGGSFTVNFLGGCVDPDTLVISDATNHRVTATLTYKSGT